VRRAEERVSATTSQSLGGAKRPHKVKRLLAASGPSGAEAFGLVKSTSRSAMMLVGSHKAMAIFNVAIYHTAIYHAAIYHKGVYHANTTAV
jgi:hypothetical protein